MEKELAALKGGTAMKKRKADDQEADGTDNLEVASPEEEDNPWTDRETFELLSINRDYSDYSAKDKTAKLQQKMTAVRESQRLPEKPARDVHEVKAQIRDLQKAGEDVESLKAKVSLPREDTPRKKRALARKIRDEEA